MGIRRSSIPSGIFSVKITRDNKIWNRVSETGNFMLRQVNIPVWMEIDSCIEMFLNKREVQNNRGSFNKILTGNFNEISIKSSFNINWNATMAKVIIGSTSPVYIANLVICNFGVNSLEKTGLSDQNNIWIVVVYLSTAFSRLASKTIRIKYANGERIQISCCREHFDRKGANEWRDGTHRDMAPPLSALENFKIF